MPLGAVHMVVRGMVQGVGFRFFVRQLASRLEVTGWVKNLPDGAVEICAEGEEPTLASFIERVKEGPRFGRVADVEMERIEPSRSRSGFTIEF